VKFSLEKKAYTYHGSSSSLALRGTSGGGGNPAGDANINDVSCCMYVRACACDICSVVGGMRQFEREKQQQIYNYHCNVHYNTGAS
jgi:hypothetical protein